MRDHNVLYIAATAIEYMIYLKICAFLFFRHERGETVNSPLWLGKILKIIVTV